MYGRVFLTCASGRICFDEYPGIFLGDVIRQTNKKKNKDENCHDGIIFEAADLHGIGRACDIHECFTENHAQQDAHYKTRDDESRDEETFFQRQGSLETVRI